MCGRIIRFLLSAIAIFLVFLGILLLALRIPLLNANTYKTALENSGIYSTAREQAEAFLLPDREDEKTAGAYVFLDPILDNLDIEEVLRTTVNNNLDNFFSWVNGTSEKLTIYFPRTTLVQSFKFEELEANLISEFRDQIAELPECTEAELLELKKNETGEELFIPECRPPGEFDDVIAASQEDLLDEIKTLFGEENPVEVALDEANLGHLNESTDLRTLIENQPGTNAGEALNSLEQIRNYVFYTLILGWALIFVAALLLVIVIITGKLSNKGTLTTISNIFLVVGVLLTVVAFLGMRLPDMILPLLEQQLMSVPVETEAFANIAQSVVEELIPVVFRLPLFVGLSIFFVSLLMRIASLLMKDEPVTETVGQKQS
ncbi:MAG: hypothetical protein ACE5DX_02545 [Candidatus Dojkabacteria bacterium]